MKRVAAVKKEEAPAAGRGFVEGLRRSIDEEVGRRPYPSDLPAWRKFRVCALIRSIP